MMNITNIDSPTVEYSKSLATIIPAYNKNGYFSSSYPTSVKPSQSMIITITYSTES
jgi:hypothetical protein